MSSTRTLEVLADRGTPRGADAVFSDALQEHGQRVDDTGSGDKGWKRRGWIIAAALLLVVAIGAPLVATGRADGPTTVAVGLGPGPSGDLGPDPVLAMQQVPKGFEVTSALNVRASFVWAGDTDPLMVYQQLSSDGTSAERVLAVGVASPGYLHKFLVFNTVGFDQTTPTTMEQVAGREVTFGRSSDVGPTPVVVGRFDVARWSESPTQTVTVATRGLSVPEITSVIAALAIVDGRPVIDRSAVPSGLEPMSVDPVHFPLHPGGTDVQLVFRNGDGATIQVGTERGTWPSAADLLWFVEGSHLSATEPDTLVSDDLVYRKLPDGAATAKSSSIEPDRLAEILQTVGMVSVDQWGALTGDKDRSSVDVMTTNIAPPTTVLGGN